MNMQSNELVTPSSGGGRRRCTEVQLWVAVCLSLAGMLLIGFGFGVRPLGEIHSSVLVAYGEIMTFAGALFGIDYHARHR